MISETLSNGTWLYVLVTSFAAICLVNLILQNGIQLLQLVVAGYKFSRQSPEPSRQQLWWQCDDSALPVSLIVPAYNEADLIAESVLALAMLEYPDHEVVVVNDGSTDTTLDILIETFELEAVTKPVHSSVPHEPIICLYQSRRFAHLRVIDKPRGGKADASNAGLNISKNPLVAIVDGDSVLEPESLMRVMHLFLNEPEDLVAVGGTVRVLNGCEVQNGRVTKVGLSWNLLALFQTMEYLRAFLLARLAWSEMGALTIVSGAFGVFRRDVLIEIGGYSLDTIGEDFELIMKIHRHAGETGKPLKVRFIPEPVCWTLVPTTLRDLASQRARWQRGALETYFKYRTMLGRRRYGKVGVLGLGNMLITDVVGPILELLGYILVPVFWACGWLSAPFAAAFFAMMFFFGVFISVSSLVVEEVELKKYPGAGQLLLLGATAVVENFGYRQLNNLFRIRGYWQFLRGSKVW